MSAPASAERLPSDVIVYLLAYIPFVPRLRALSVLSKRWRAAFIKSVADDRAFASASHYELVRNYLHNPAATGFPPPQLPVGVEVRPIINLHRNRRSRYSPTFPSTSLHLVRLLSAVQAIPDAFMWRGDSVAIDPPAQ